MYIAHYRAKVVVEEGKETQNQHTTNKHKMNRILRCPSLELGWWVKKLAFMACVYHNMLYKQTENLELGWWVKELFIMAIMVYVYHNMLYKQTENLELGWWVKELFILAIMVYVYHNMYKQTENF